MNNNNRVLKVVSVALALALANLSHGLILNVTGQGVKIPAPGSTLLDETEGLLQFGFDEKQGVELTSNLTTDGGSIAAGTWINSHMIFLDRDEGITGSGDANGLSTTARWYFDGMVLGILSYGNEYSSSTTLGNAGTVYPLGPVTVPFDNRGLEIGAGFDGYTIFGDELEVKMRVTEPGDWIRVVTAYNPERIPDTGSTAFLLAGGLLGFAALQRRLRR